MSSLKDVLGRGEYWGRLLVLGKTSEGENFAAYAVTGRSPSSRARKFVQDGDSVKVEPTNPDEVAKGNPALLIYRAMALVGDKIVVSNGAQTDAITSLLGIYPQEELSGLMRSPYSIEGIDVFKYEPDEPNFTPRIAGTINQDVAEFAIIKRNDAGDLSRKFTDARFAQGRANLIATYSGRNVPKGIPLPSFNLNPLWAEVIGTTPGDIALELYDALAPSSGDDFRVAAAAATVRDGKLLASIVNRSS